MLKVDAYLPRSVLVDDAFVIRGMHCMSPDLQEAFISSYADEGKLSGHDGHRMEIERFFDRPDRKHVFARRHETSMTRAIAAPCSRCYRSRSVLHSACVRTRVRGPDAIRAG